jgi:hypothetical protein
MTHGAGGSLSAQTLDYRNGRYNYLSDTEFFQYCLGQHHALIALHGQWEQPDCQLPIGSRRKLAIALGIDDELKVLPSCLVPLSVFGPHIWINPKLAGYKAR